MAGIVSEGLENIGYIDDDGFIFDQSYNCIATINDSGYIVMTAGSGIYGKIDKDGTIRNSALDAVGRIQADGYVYIHSKRVCRVSSKFIESITPDAYNWGEPSRQKENPTYTDDDYSPSHNGCLTKIIIKVIIGIILGVVGMVNGWGGIEGLLVGPVLVFLFSLVPKIINILFY